MDTKEKEWEELFKGIDFDDSNMLPEDKELDEKIELNESFTIYFNDYCKISYLNDIKENHLYLFNKWKCIFFHCVKLDDFYYYLNNKNVNLQSISSEFVKNIIIGNNNKDNSLNSENNRQLSIENNDSNSSLKGKLINNSSITDNSISCDFSNSKENEIRDLNILNKEKNDIMINKSSEIKLNEFKLTEAKKSLQIYDNEKIGGTEYELQCKRVLYLMLIFIGRDNYKIFNPHKIPIQKFINRLNIKELGNEKLTDSDSFEIDVIINDFKVSDLKTLIKEYSSHFLLTDKLRISEIDENTKVNFIGEISRNFIIQIINKSVQLKTYFASFKILEKLNEQNCNLSEGEKDYIFSCFNLQKNSNMNIFFIITDGSYLVLRFVIETIFTIKKNNLLVEKEDIYKFIDDEIDKNKNLLNHLMSNKYRNLNYFIYKTHEALKYLDDKNIRYCIFYMGEREENRFEDFFKEKEGIKNPILFQTKFNNKIKNLINDLINLKEMIIFKINEFGKNIQNLIGQERLLNIIKEHYHISKLSNYFKIPVHFYYADKDLNIALNDKYFIKPILIDNGKFKKIFDKLSKTKNLESLFIFIDNKNLLNKNADNPLLLIKSEIKFPDIYNFIGNYIKKNINIFENIINQKIDKKIKKLEENKNIYDIKCELNLKIIIEKLKNDKDLNLDAENLVNILYKNSDINIEKTNDYIDGLVNNEKKLENLINKKFEKDFMNEIVNNFSRLLENLKSSIIYDYIIKKIIRQLIISKWDFLYYFDK